MTRLPGRGAYAPEQVITNHDLEKRLDTSVAWIVQGSGIRERRIIADGERTATLAV